MWENVRFHRKPFVGRLGRPFGNCGRQLLWHTLEVLVLRLREFCGPTGAVVRISARNGIKRGVGSSNLLFRRCFSPASSCHRIDIPIPPQYPDPIEHCALVAVNSSVCKDIQCMAVLLPRFVLRGKRFEGPTPSNEPWPEVGDGEKGSPGRSTGPASGHASCSSTVPASAPCTSFPRGFSPKG